ncbi:hypothetical protein [Chryseobacterium sp.]|uniref:hypothetical protein n=1 Tax=Chryseobacterium sp. TaxID=1871047 RepID=UPI003890A2D1
MKGKTTHKSIRALIIVLSVPGLLLIAYLLFSQIKLFLVNVSDYANNSIEIKLTDVTSISNMREDYGFGTGSGTGKSVVQILDGDKYYNLSYYEKNKADRKFYFFDEKKLPKSISIIVNREELEKKGSKQNPIPVFNFSMKHNEMIWDNESYRENIRKYLTYEK